MFYFAFFCFLQLLRKVICPFKEKFKPRKLLLFVFEREIRKKRRKTNKKILERKKTLKSLNRVSERKMNILDFYKDEFKMALEK